MSWVLIVVISKMSDANRIIGVLCGMIGNHYYSIVMDKTWKETYETPKEKLSYFKLNAKPEDIEKYIVLGVKKLYEDSYGVTVEIKYNNVAKLKLPDITFRKEFYYGMDDNKIVDYVFGPSSDIYVGLTVLCKIFDNFVPLDEMSKVNFDNIDQRLKDVFVLLLEYENIDATFDEIMIDKIKHSPNYNIFKNFLDYNGIGL